MPPEDEIESEQLPLSGDSSSETPVESVESQEPVNPLREALSKYEVQLEEDWDDRQILDQWGQISERAQSAPDADELTRLREFAKYGEKFVPHLSEIEKFLASQQEPPKEEAKPLWNPPSLDETDTAFIQAGLKSDVITEDATGTLSTTDPRFSESVRRYNEREAYLGRQIQSFRDNPYDFVWRGIEDKVTEREKQLLDRIEKLESRTVQQDTSSFFDSVADQYGQTKDGKFEMNAKGRAFQTVYQSLPESIPEYQRLQQAAELVEKIGGLFEPSPVTKNGKKSDHEKGEQSKKDFLIERKSLNGAGAVPNRSAKVPQADEHDESGARPEKPKRFLQEALQLAKDEGVDLSN